MQKRIFFLVSLLMLFTLSATAQIITSSMSGKVTIDDSGETAIGATVQVVHEPSGTRYSAVTNVNGRFAIQGMRSGGPYKVTISYIGFKPKTVRGITLELAETYNLKVQLKEDAQELGEVIVSGKASKFAAEKTGASTNISNQTIIAMPTVSRSITDIARVSPYANGMSFAGANARMSNFTLDGANLNNNFGLSSSLPGGGTPVSIEAIDEVQVVVSPFDVRQSNFIGGGINAVTKSGTNLFKGTAYVYHTNENMHGNRIDNATMADPGKDRKTTYGFTLGGPIIKDKLFFFANYEKSVVPTTPNRWRGSEDGVADSKNNISRAKLSDLQQVSEFVSNKYGYNTGSWTDFPADEENVKYLARLDWNINQNHHLAVRFNHTNNSVWNAPTGVSNDMGQSWNMNTQSRFSQSSMSYANTMYKAQNKVTTWSGNLNSRFSNVFSNELLFTYSDIDDVRDTNSSPFPFIDIYEPDASGKVAPYITLGYEFCTPGNRVRNKITTITDNMTFYLGSHKVMAGVSYEHQVAYNTYLRSFYGSYSYNSLNDFLTGATPAGVALTWGYNGDTEPTDKVTFNQLGAYLQDEWQMFDRFKLTAGLRIDNLMFDNNDLLANKKIDDLDFNGTHLTTGEWPKNHITFSPRLGFVWDILGDKSIKLRGGSGLFVGRMPLVFLTNMPGSTGMSKYLYKSSNDKNHASAVLNAFNGGLVTDPAQMRDLIVANNPDAKTTISPEEGSLPSSISAVSSDFKMPQIWKSSIGLDINLPASFPITLSGEFTYSKMINDVTLRNINIIEPNDTWERMKGADNRYIYPKDYKYTGKYDVLMLDNTSKGYGWTANVTLNAEPIKGLHIMGAYTHTVNKQISALPGSNANSVLNAMFSVNGPSFATLQSAASVIPDRVIANVSYDFGNEHFGLFYEGCASNTPYTYYYSNDINGDGYTTDLMYIPANDSEIRFATEADRVAFWNYVEQDEYLRNHRGEYAEAYAAHTQMVHRFDFRYAHDITFCLGKTRHKLQLSADVKNIGNLFNSEWGVFKNMAPANGGQILRMTKLDNGTPVFAMNKVNGEYPTQTWDYIHSYGQCWQIQIGAKYFFDQLTDAQRDEYCKPCQQELSQTAIDDLNRLVAEKEAENARLKSELAAAMNKPAEIKVQNVPVEKVVEKEVKVTELASNPVSVFFNNNEDKIASLKDLEDVRTLAETAKQRKAKIVLTGYADSTGNAEYNKKLAQNRAENVAKELEKMGIARADIEIVTVGADNTLSEKSHNRRVTVNLKK